MSERKLKVVRRIGKCMNEGCKNFGRFVRVSKVDGRKCGSCGNKRKVFVIVEREMDGMEEFIKFGRYNTEWSEKDLDEKGRLKLRRCVS